MKQKIYPILVILIIVFVLISICYYYNRENNMNKFKTEEKVSSQPVEENILYVEIPISNEEKIDSKASDWNLILVNKYNIIPTDYEVKTEIIEGKWEIDYRAREAAEKMLNAARNEGLDPVICSAYRSSEEQNLLFNNKVRQYKSYGYIQEVAEEKASYWVAFPRTSEHEIGLALDIVSNQYQVLDKNQENTVVQKWLMEHCYEYGFILRYPTDKKDITKINYEPWHYRYVGEKDAMLIKEKGYCLEEYVDFLIKD